MTLKKGMVIHTRYIASKQVQHLVYLGIVGQYRLMYDLKEKKAFTVDSNFYFANRMVKVIKQQTEGNKRKAETKRKQWIKEHKYLMEE